MPKQTEIHGDVTLTITELALVILALDNMGQVNHAVIEIEAGEKLRDKLEVIEEAWWDHG